MADPLPEDEAPLARAFATALAHRQGKETIRTLRTAKDVQFLGNEVIKVIRQ